MSYDATLQLVSSQFESLLCEREEHLRKAAEVEQRLRLIGEQLGIELPFDSKPSPTRLVSEDKRSTGTMSARMLSILLEANRGYSRVELRDELAMEPKFYEQLTRNLNSYYNNITRYLRSGKVVEVNGLLYHPNRAPLPEGEVDPTGQHLPANVTTLFSHSGKPDA